ncbi:ATP-binding protein [Desulfovibrio psychrotolerans]|uniref:ATP-binding protein n=1 Tax=Desulfovibrio psychrotolerans TaxID=415242 RepID=UPI00157B5E1C|nr:ATP-binding protein [Desulfovibrio psychrotolerans]
MPRRRSASRAPSDSAAPGEHAPPCGSDVSADSPGRGDGGALSGAVQEPLEPHKATANRLSAAEIRRQADAVRAHLGGRLAETIPIPFIVLNEARQIVYANGHAVRFFGCATEEEALGFRPGERIFCVHSQEMGGCGESPACGHCGNVRAVLGVQEGAVYGAESRVLTKHHGLINALNLQVDAAGTKLDEEHYTIVYLRDISREKDRELLERVFLHDAVNALGGISGAMRLLGDAVDEKLRELALAVEERASLLVREARFMQLLFSAESTDLMVMRDVFSARDMLEELRMLYSTNVFAEGRHLVLDPQTLSAPDITLTTDRALLQRSLENLVKNALEASRPGQTVTMGYLSTGGAVHFFVRSEPFIPRHVQLQMFQRTFSTKGRGRGLGTYSARLFVTNYLGGTVSFESTPEEGTTFYVRIPLE